MRVARHQFKGLDRPYFVLLIEEQSIKFRNIRLFWRVKDLQTGPIVFFGNDSGSIFVMNKSQLSSTERARGNFILEDFQSTTP